MSASAVASAGPGDRQRRYVASVVGPQRGGRRRQEHYQSQ